MKIAEIGETFHQAYVDRITYFSDDYMLDSDILIIDLNSIDQELSLLTIGSEHGEAWLPYETYKYILEKVEDRTKQLTDYFNSGGNLWLRLPRQKTLTYEFQTEVDAFENVVIDLYALVSLESKHFTLNSKKGSNIIFPDPLFHAFFEEFKCSYSHSFSKYKGMSIANINLTKQPVSIILSKSRGNIIVMPEISIDADSNDDFEMKTSYIASAFELIDKELKARYKVIPEVVTPEWCSGYYLSNEGAQITKLNKLFVEHDGIQLKIQQQQQLLSTYAELKQLLFATSSTLEERVKQILKEFGYQLLHTEKNRDDVIISHKDQVAVIEIKGQKGSAAEANAAQLMKWVTTYHHDMGKSPKGILIINAFKDKALIERNESPFPDQMMDYCKKMELTLLTTTQLLGLYLDFKTGDITFKQIHSLLWKTIGTLNYTQTKIKKN